MRYSASEMRNRWMEACYRQGESGAARIARGNVCYRGLAKHVREMNRDRRSAIFADFFGDFPNGKRLSEVADLVAGVDFTDPAPLTELVKPVGAHLSTLGMEPAIIEEVPWGSRHLMDEEWTMAWRQFKLTEEPLPGPLGRFLKEIVDALLMTIPETEVGRTAIYNPRDLIIRLAWDLTDGRETAWDHLGSIALLGWIPIGLGENGRFLVSRLPELEPAQIDG